MKINKKQIDILSDNNLLSDIYENRTKFMGLAMILVILYHGLDGIYNPIGPLNRGYVGVDIFMFLSGFGLNESFKKNSLSKFYKNRFIRIYPLYFIGVLLALFITKSWGVGQFLLNVSTLGYYLYGGIYRFDWYLESIFILYLLFPILKKLKRYIYIYISLICIVIPLIYPIQWWYDCLISRVPIFLLGVVFASLCHSRTTYKFIKVGIIGIILYYPLKYFNISPFFRSSLLVIPIIAITKLWLSNTRNKIIHSILEFIGRYSLECYLSNILILRFFKFIDADLVLKIVLYICVQPILSYLLILVNRWINVHLVHHNRL